MSDFEQYSPEQLEIIKVAQNCEINPYLMDIYSQLNTELKKIPEFVGIVPLGSAQGKWILRKIGGAEKWPFGEAYNKYLTDDIDLGVVIDCNPSDAAEATKKIYDAADNFLQQFGLSACPAVQPKNFFLNLNEVALENQIKMLVEGMVKPEYLGNIVLALQGLDTNVAEVSLSRINQIAERLGLTLDQKQEVNLRIRNFMNEGAKAEPKHISGFRPSSKIVLTSEEQELLDLYNAEATKRYNNFNLFSI